MYVYYIKNMVDGRLNTCSIITLYKVSSMEISKTFNLFLKDINFKYVQPCSGGYF